MSASAQIAGAGGMAAQSDPAASPRWSSIAPPENVTAHHRRLRAVAQHRVAAPRHGKALRDDADRPPRAAAIGANLGTTGVGIGGPTMYQGPYFGDATPMVVGVQRSDNVFDATDRDLKHRRRQTWNKVVDMPSVSGGSRSASRGTARSRGIQVTTRTTCRSQAPAAAASTARRDRWDVTSCAARDEAAGQFWAAIALALGVLVGGMHRHSRRDVPWTTARAVQPADG